MNASVFCHAFSDASANSSCFRSKKLCGAPSYVTSSCSTPAASSAAAKRGVVVGRDVRVVAGLEREDRRHHLAGALRRAGRAVGALSRPAVEADRAGEPVTSRRGQPRVAAAHAEADREDRRAALRAQPGDARRDVRLNLGRRDDADVLHVVEVVVALRDAGGAPEVVERDGRVAALGEAQRELLVEAVEATHVRQDHDAGRRRPRRAMRPNAANRLPSAASSTSSSCETAAPEMTGIGGSESRSKHTAAKR